MGARMELDVILGAYNYQMHKLSWDDLEQKWRESVDVEQWTCRQSMPSRRKMDFWWFQFFILRMGVWIEEPG